MALWTFPPWKNCLFPIDFLQSNRIKNSYLRKRIQEKLSEAKCQILEPRALFSLNNQVGHTKDRKIHINVPTKSFKSAPWKEPQLHTKNITSKNNGQPSWSNGKSHIKFLFLETEWMTIETCRRDNDDDANDEKRFAISRETIKRFNQACTRSGTGTLGGKEGNDFLKRMDFFVKNS